MATDPPSVNPSPPPEPAVWFAPASAEALDSRGLVFRRYADQVFDGQLDADRETGAWTVARVILPVRDPDYFFDSAGRFCVALESSDGRELIEPALRRAASKLTLFEPDWSFEVYANQERDALMLGFDDVIMYSRRLRGATIVVIRAPAPPVWGLVERSAARHQPIPGFWNGGRSPRPSDLHREFWDAELRRAGYGWFTELRDYAIAWGDVQPVPEELDADLFLDGRRGLALVTHAPGSTRPWATLRFIYVVPDCQRQNYGTLLVDRIRERPYGVVRVFVASPLKGARPIVTPSGLSARDAARVFFEYNSVVLMDKKDDGSFAGYIEPAAARSPRPSDEADDDDNEPLFVRSVRAKPLEVE